RRSRACWRVAIDAQLKEEIGRHAGAATGRSAGADVIVAARRRLAAPAHRHLAEALGDAAGKWPPGDQAGIEAVAGENATNRARARDRAARGGAESAGKPLLARDAIQTGGARPVAGGADLVAPRIAVRQHHAALAGLAHLRGFGAGANA